VFSAVNQPGKRSVGHAAASIQGFVRSRAYRSLTHCNLYLVKVLYDYARQGDDELTLVKGAIVTVTSLVAEGWWDGKLADGSHGMFPNNFVEVYVEEVKPPPMPPRNTAPPAKPKKLARALHRYDAADNTELSLQVDDLITVTEEVRNTLGEKAA